MPIQDLSGNGVVEKILDFPASIQSVAASAFAIVPSDTVDMLAHVRGIYIGTSTGAQALRILTVGGDDVTFQNVKEGDVIPVQARRVFATSTTASNLVGLV